MKQKDIEVAVVNYDYEACLTLEKEIIELKQKRERFDVVKFLKGLFFNKYFLGACAWYVVVLFALGIIGRIQRPDNNILVIIILAAVVVTVFWMLSEAWKKLIKRGELRINANVGATASKTANTVANIADVISAKGNNS